jgi:ribosomal protein S18 acetylase RimI-like enzyme
MQSLCKKLARVLREPQQEIHRWNVIDFLQKSVASNGQIKDHSFWHNLNQVVDQDNYILAGYTKRRGVKLGDSIRWYVVVSVVPRKMRCMDLEILILEVNPAFRGMGLGRVAVSEAERFLSEFNSTITLRSTPQASSFWKKMGYKRTADDLMEKCI